jgi:hypothetical protein
LTNTAVRTLAFSGTNIYAGTDGGVFLYTGGSNWNQVGLTNNSVRALAVSGTNIYAGSDGGVFLYHGGANWTAINTGLTNTDVTALAVYGTDLFAGISSGGVWKRPLLDSVTSVERLSTDLPIGFSLEQNYPNPFNPSTIISFSLPSRTFVSLKVCDALGREVAMLINEVKSAGTYAASFTAATMSSGVYFYRLQAGSFSQTRKLMLLR